MQVTTLFHECIFSISGTPLLGTWHRFCHIWWVAYFLGLKIYFNLGAFGYSLDTFLNVNRLLFECIQILYVFFECILDTILILFHSGPICSQFADHFRTTFDPFSVYFLSIFGPILDYFETIVRPFSARFCAIFVSFWAFFISAQFGLFYGSFFGLFDEFYV